jgi:YegS/Rv2252/BmrU family lipid kinase
LKRIAFIVRGNLKNPDTFRSNITKYFQSEFEVFLKFTRHNGHAVEIVHELLEKGIDYMIGVGGDGTFNEVVNGYMRTTPQKRINTILVAFPRGSGNDFSRTTGRIVSMEHLYNAIKQNEIVPFDLIEANFTENGVEKTRYYNNSFDIGLGGLVCKYMNNSGKTWGSNFTYFYNILRSFLFFKRIPVELTSDTVNFKGKVLLIAVNNGIYFGSGLGIAPKAQLDDGKANLVIARKINILQFLLFMPLLKKAKKIEIKELFYYEVTWCKIDSPIKDCPIEMDGEVVGSVPIHLKVLKHAAKTLKV